MIVDVTEKVIVVTGSSRGIGKELITSFAKEGAKVVINYLSSADSAKQLYNEIILYNPNCVLIQADITKQDDVNRFYHETINSFGKVDVLINNAGICDDNPIQLMPEEQWQRVIDVNLTGAYLCSRAFSKSMVQQKSGKIINIASLKGQIGCEGQVNYSASKAGLIGFTKALARELGRFNIAVNAICPGFVATDLNRHIPTKSKKAESDSLLSINSCLSDLINFTLLLSSDSWKGISGRIFNLDSRLYVNS
jgi:3-oxoacyl-[acyl-carrier protein] reductase